MADHMPWPEVVQGLSTGHPLNDGTWLVMKTAFQTKEAMMK